MRGIIADRIGARNSITLGVAAWSVFSFLTGMAGSLTNLMWVRVFFGVSEGLHPPAAFKALSSASPLRRRIWRCSVRCMPGQSSAMKAMVMVWLCSLQSSTSPAGLISPLE